MENELYHYGVKRRSGRYPYGSGGRPYQSEERKAKENAKSSDKKEKIIKSALTIAGGIAISYAGVKMTNSPAVRAMMLKVLDAVGDRKVKNPSSKATDSGIFSKALGRMLTIDEAIEKGLL